MWLSSTKGTVGSLIIPPLQISLRLIPQFYKINNTIGFLSLYYNKMSILYAIVSVILAFLLITNYSYKYQDKSSDRIFIREMFVILLIIVVFIALY